MGTSMRPGKICAKSMKLAHFVQGSDNGISLVRLIAALAVLFSHSFAVASGRGDPLTARLGMNMGAIAEDIFFITSGLLVTGSLLSRKSTVEFVWVQVLRIYPGLVVMAGGEDPQWDDKPFMPSASHTGVE